MTDIHRRHLPGTCSFGDSAKDVKSASGSLPRNRKRNARPSIVYVPFLRRDFGGLGPVGKVPSQDASA